MRIRLARKCIKSCALLAVPAMMLIACSATYKAPIASMQMRSVFLQPEKCAEAYQLIESRIRVMADVDRGAFQIRQTKDLNVFNTALFKRWQEAAYKGIYWSFDRSFEFYPHIMNYDLMGDLYYYGCEYSGQSIAGRVWSGKREGFDPDPVIAAKYYEFAAIGHVPRSQYRLGLMLFEGDGIPRDEETGIQWLTSAALEGYQDARDYLKELGLDVPEASSPNTYSVLAQDERAQYMALQRAIHARQQQIRQNWATVAIVAVGAYYAADNLATGAAATTSGSTAPSTTQPQRVIVQRSRPVFCTSMGNVTITGTSYTAFANGTVSTFCH